ncbi:MAG: glycosyltransferase, partial [Planctomycetes bacterium]|nr:glycosyltransferase [Planctomycetota bacterium]
HLPDNDARFIYDLIPYLRDRRYVRVEGRPLVAVYRPESLSDAAATAATWRRACRDEGVGELHLVAVRSFDKRNPREFGFDAAIQFPPLLIPAENRAADPTVGADPSFRGSLFEYEDAARFSLAEAAPDATLYRGVMPAWDNTARRMERATAWMHASPEAYGRWLREAIALTGREQPPDRRLVFVNAWNEWAEGAHLEPDVRHGYRHLEETAAAVGLAPQAPAPRDDLRLLVLSHDAHLAGAQMVTLRTVQQWKRAGIEGVRIVCVGGGVLRPAFEAAYPTTVLEDLPDEPGRRRALAAAADFAGRPPSVVYSSTVVNGPVLEWIRPLGMPIVTHAHELQKSIEHWAPGEIFAATRRASDLFMAAAPAIRDNLVVRHGIAADLVQVVPAHIACDDEAPSTAVIEALRSEWGADPTGIVVVGCGTTDWRKGPDLFCEIAARAVAHRSDLRFVWAGGDADYHREWLAERNLEGHVHFLGTRGDVRRLLHAADLFLLSSREDPMPLVALEAAATALPVVCFAGAGDIPAFVGDDGGVVVPMEDVAAATAAILRLADDAGQRRSLGRSIAGRVRATYDSRVVATETLRLLREVAAGRRAWAAAAAPLVSVIVPNYEHAPHLPERLASILDQDVVDIEIILLDDRSGDGSLAILEEFARREPRASVVANTVNSGSAFRQWRKGLVQARGRYVWITESDDAARPGLLRTLVAML